MKRTILATVLSATLALGALASAVPASAESANAPVSASKVQVIASAKSADDLKNIASSMSNGKKLESDDVSNLNDHLLQTNLLTDHKKQGSTETFTYSVDNGAKIVIEKQERVRIASSGAHGTSVPMLRASVDNWVIYVFLNRTDQAALTNGSSAVLGALICAIPAVGWAACAGVIAALAIAATYINANGYCSNELAIHVGGAPWGYTHCA